MQHEIQTPAKPFWDSLDAGEFRIPECQKCESAFFPPGPVCPTCGSTNFDWIDSGEATLYSFTKQHQTAPGFESPLVIGLVELASGPRVLTPIEAEYDTLSIGIDVQLTPTGYTNGYNRGSQSNQPFFTAVLSDETNES